MDLFYSPGSCSIGIHVLLEEIGKPYGLRRLDIRGGEQYGADYIAINPKSKVPALLRDDGTVLTEFPAIATWLAMTNPDKNLLPADPEEWARALEVMDYVVATIHMHGFQRIFRPGNYTPNEADHPAVQARGREIFVKGLAVLDKILADRDYVIGRFSIADAAVFYVEFWAADRLKLDLPVHCAAHLARMKARPAVQAVLRDEGFAA